MARKPNKPSPTAEQASSSTATGLVAWKFTKSMNMRDLARDDDYLSHLFIEKLGSLGATSYLLVHRMDPSRRLPKTDTADILSIVQRLIRSRTSAAIAIKQAVNELLELPSVLYFIRDYEQSQISAFATHASRYLELFSPAGSIEIAQTSRYSGITGKNELCILATRPMQPGFLIAELKGSMADLTEEEDRELKRTGPRNDGGTRRDFSVIHSKQLKKNHLFLGPARFVNHDCDNNCELFRNGRYITFRAIKPIIVGQELTAHYGEGYFGKNNRHCLCETCERRGKGGFSPQADDGTPSSQDNEDSDDDDDSDSDSTSVVSEDSRKGKEHMNLNERRTRRGVYLILPDNDSDESEEDDDEEDAQATAKARAESVAATEVTEVSEASSSNDAIDLANSDSVTLVAKPKRGRPSKPLPSQSTTPSSDRFSFKLAITTRGRKAREASLSSNASRLQTPLSGGSASPAQSNSRASTSAPTISRPSLRPRKSASASISALHSGPRPRGRPRKHPLPGETLSAAKAEEKLVAGNRGRSSLASKVISTADTEVLQQKAIPSIPACITCSTPLPVSDAEGSRKGKIKDVKEECPRCRRHYLIYCAPWPQRNPIPGSRFSSTRESTPSDLSHKVTTTSISTVDQKLKTARLAQLKRSREQDAELESAQIAKRQKISASPASPQKGLQNASKRSLVSNMKLRGDTEVKLENADDVPLHGPLGKSVSRNVQKRAADNSSASTSRKRGRTDQTADKTSEVPPFEEDGDDRRDKTFWPTLPALPPLGDGIKRTGLLNLRPNPMHVSRWRASPLRSAHSAGSTPTLVDDDTDEATSDEHPATPENIDSNDATPEVLENTETRQPSGARDVPPTSDEDEDEDEDNTEGKPKKLVISTLKSFGLISRPSPQTLSKRVWAPPALIADPDCGTTNEPTTPKRKRRRHISSSSPKQAEDMSCSSDRTPTSVRSIRVLKSRATKSMFDDLDVSSGEEDVVVPGPSNSNLYLLQHNATFDSPASAQDSSPHSSEDKPCISSCISSHSSELSDTSPLKALDKPNLLTLGPLHSDFLASAPGPVLSPSFVDAGWESDSSL